jgi:hypothetical protein
MLQYLWIGLGGFIGANARYLLQQWAANRWGTDFPYGTLLANHIKRLPVVDAEGRLVGLVGRGGVLQVLGREIEKN